jgi:hypothetical protein
LLFLILRENLPEPAINFLLQFLQLLLLLRGQIQPLLEKGRQDLARSGRPSEAPGATLTGTAESAGARSTGARLAGTTGPTGAGTTEATAATAPGTARPTGSTKTAGSSKATAAASLRILRIELGGQRHELLLGYDSVLVRVGTVEQPEQSHIRYLVLGQLAILVLVERHHSNDDG